jgi:hypothetical protein
METVSERRRKRIVEHIISGFDSAFDATQFAKAVDFMVTDKVGKQRFQFFIAAPDLKLAITDKWKGPTVLKTHFLDLKDQHISIFITEGMRKTIRKNNLILEKEVVREKPQPQRIEASYFKHSKIFKVG